MELVEKLKFVNASELVDRLLTNHFKEKPIDEMTLEEAEAELLREQKRKIMEEAEAKIKELENGQE